MTRPKVAVIGTGGTIHSFGEGPFDLLDYAAKGKMVGLEELLPFFSEAQSLAELIAVPYASVPSPDMGFKDWKAIVEAIAQTEAEHPDLAGFVITHGTATLEETAYFLSLTVRSEKPVVVVGAQRPPSAISSDGPINFCNAVRCAASEGAKGMGVLVLLNDEIHAAREVTKTSTFRMHTFRTPDFGVLGHADGDEIVFYRRPLRKHAPETEFDLRSIKALPRVDIVYGYTGCDETAARAFVEAGAKGIVCAGMAPGSAGKSVEAYLARAVAEQGITAMISTRAGSGRVFKGQSHTKNGFLTADNLNPQKARLLLALALACTSDPEQIERIFKTY